MKTRQQSSLDAERQFRESVILLGAVLAPGAAYKNNCTPVPLICDQGHTYQATPSWVQQGGGLCGKCAPARTDVEARFWARVVELRATPAPGATYTNSITAVPLICKLGHACSPTPTNVQQGGGICNTCAGQDPATVQAAFWARVAEIGATPAPGAVYVDTNTPVPLICTAGHACNPRPGNVQQGDGICVECVASFDRVYLLKHASTGAIKVGVSSGGRRVNVHVGRGYELVEQWLGLTHARAAEVEKQAHAFWRRNGWPAVAAAPKDGWTETAGLQHLGATRTWMSDLLGPGTCPEAV
jgi:hypothetical protein